MRCSKCGAEAKEITKFCGQCGAKFVAVPPPVTVEGEDGLYYCNRHQKETTPVTCGRCERPICTKYIVVGPAGVRCKDCARNRVAIRPRGVLHDVGSGLSSPGAQRVWYLVMFAS